MDERPGRAESHPNEGDHEAYRCVRGLSGREEGDQENGVGSPEDAEEGLKDLGLRRSERYRILKLAPELLAG